MTTELFLQSEDRKTMIVGANGRTLMSIFLSFLFSIRLIIDVIHLRNPATRYHEIKKISWHVPIA